MRVCVRGAHENIHTRVRSPTIRRPLPPHHSVYSGTSRYASQTSVSMSYDQSSKKNEDQGEGVCIRGSHHPAPDARSTSKRQKHPPRCSTPHQDNALATSDREPRHPSLLDCTASFPKLHAVSNKQTSRMVSIEARHMSDDLYVPSFASNAQLD